MLYAYGDENWICLWFWVRAKPNEDLLGSLSQSPPIDLGIPKQECLFFIPNKLTYY